MLELGPGKHTIVKRCDVMVKPEDDAWGRPISEVEQVLLHDATEKPWPVGDKQYAMFTALQVWEHLGNKQSRAFREVMRISKSAVLSFPYKWKCPKTNANYPEHQMIDEELIGDRTLNVRAEQVTRTGRTGPKVSKGPRITYYWEFQMEHDVETACGGGPTLAARAHAFGVGLDRLLDHACVLGISVAH